MGLKPYRNSGYGELKKVCDSGVTFNFLSALRERKQPLCKFVGEEPTCEVLLEKLLWAPSTVISRHGLPTLYVKQLRFMSLSQAFFDLKNSRKEKGSFPLLCDFLCPGSLGSCPEKKSPKGSLCCVNPLR